MHEAILARGTFDSVFRHIIEGHIVGDGRRKIKKIKIIVGNLHRVDKEAFIAHFAALAKSVGSDKFSDCLEIDFKEIKASAMCKKCGINFKPEISSIVFLKLVPHTICLKCGELSEVSREDGYKIDVEIVKFENK